MKSFDVTILNDQRVIVVTIEGAISLKDMITVAEGIYSHADYDPNLDCIMDLSETKVEMSYEDMFAYVGRIENDERRIRGATAFVTKDPNSFGMARMFDSLSIELPENIYFEKSMADALAVLTKK